MPRLWLLPLLLATACGPTDRHDGVHIAYETAGSGSGALVFIHGWSCDSNYWVAQVETFARDYQVVTIDLAGHGESGLERTEWTIEAFGRDVRLVVEELGLDSVILIGHSMGGQVALEAARRLPEKTIGIVAVDSLHDFEFRWDRDKWQSTIRRFEQDFRATCAEFVRSMFLPGADPELVAGIGGDMCAAPPEIATAILARFPDHDIPSAAAAAGVPIRAINGETAPTRIEVNRRHADFDAHVMRGAGHFLMLERPDEFNEILRQVIEELTSVEMT